MDIDVQDIAPCVKQIKVTISTDEVESEKSEQVGKLAKSAKIPGFRAGKAPKAVIEKMYGGQVTGDVAQKAIDKAYRKALEDNNITPVGDPKVEDMVIEAGKPISFTATVETFPSVDLNDISGITLERKLAPVKDEEIESALKQYQERQASFELVEGRNVENGDHVVIDYSAAKDDGTELPHFKGEARLVLVDKEQMFEGFYNGIVGTKKGEAKEFTANLPEDYPDPETAGIEVNFSIKVNEIKTKVLPGIDDQFASEVSEFDTLDELKEDVRKNAEEKNRGTADNALRDDLLTKLIEENSFELPPNLVERQAESILKHRNDQFAQQGIDPSTLGLDEDGITENAKEDAVRSIKEQAILTAYGVKAEIKVEDDDMNKEIERLTAMFGQPADVTYQQLSQSGGLEAVANQLFHEKVYKDMLGVVTINEVNE